MEKAVNFRTIMNGPYPDHPSEDALERFLLNQSEEDELEIVETHILACEACVTRLETLEVSIEATKLALQNLQAEPAKQPARSMPVWNQWLRWLTLPQISFAGAGLAACCLALAFVEIPRDVSTTAFRGTETVTVSEWLPITLHLSAKDLPVTSVSAEIADAKGGIVWQGAASVRNEEAIVKAPRFKAAGQYYVRLYSGAELLREYSVRAKPLFGSADH